MLRKGPRAPSTYGGPSARSPSPPPPQSSAVTNLARAIRRPHVCLSVRTETTHVPFNDVRGEAVAGKVGVTLKPHTSHFTLHTPPPPRQHTRHITPRPLPFSSLLPFSHQKPRGSLKNKYSLSRRRYSNLFFQIISSSPPPLSSLIYQYPHSKIPNSPLSLPHITYTQWLSPLS